uniref:Sodium channel toxin meuNaTx-1 n=1 Tax=Mesobuthus eupeus TaxID=34648 RepID=A0A143MHH1_MESEU|nr:sodium channel toxin meuNaTx-1 [Mesobuthus eupeus]
MKRIFILIALLSMLMGVQNYDGYLLDKTNDCMKVCSVIQSCNDLCKANGGKRALVSKWAVTVQELTINQNF